MFHPDFPQTLRQPGRKRWAIAILVVALVAAAWFCFARLWTAANILPVDHPIPFTAEEVAWFEEISAFSLAPFASGHRFDHPDEIETFCTFLESLQCYEAEPDAYLLQLDEGRQIDVHLQGGSVVKLRLMFQHSRLQGLFENGRCAQRRGILGRWQVIFSQESSWISRKNCAVQRTKGPSFGHVDIFKTGPRDR